MQLPSFSPVLVSVPKTVKVYSHDDFFNGLVARHSNWRASRVNGELCAYGQIW
jgi:hypothetical protein